MARHLFNFVIPVGWKTCNYVGFQGIRCTTKRTLVAYKSPISSSAVLKCAVESVHPSEAHRKKQNEAWKHLDVRTEEEYKAGHAKDSICVPVMVRGQDGKLQDNPMFLQDVSKFFKKDDKIVVSCLKGPRAMKAIEKLREAGFSQLVNVEGGFEKWQESALPVET
ncbi:hypothetical protein GAYE_SCF13G3439 [Galdieria yellowstonensis]|uniref:Rhodanese domain-containing protein n=1 Tax=Galdieria yellowstonensis TaxID=3028027 RepID=A0AAV9IEB0_9RHOD|nr:hypothetical protein GAYE_SCF13G3439 [Galdieria yellowstonensis]